MGDVADGDDAQRSDVWLSCSGFPAGLLLARLAWDALVADLCGVEQLGLWLIAVGHRDPHIRCQVLSGKDEGSWLVQHRLALRLHGAHRRRRQVGRPDGVDAVLLHALTVGQGDDHLVGAVGTDLGHRPDTGPAGRAGLRHWLGDVDVGEQQCYALHGRRGAELRVEAHVLARFDGGGWRQAQQKRRRSDRVHPQFILLRVRSRRLPEQALAAGHSRRAGELSLGGADNLQRTGVAVRQRDTRRAVRIEQRAGQIELRRLIQDQIRGVLRIGQG